jgi:hypothetical protein
LTLDHCYVAGVSAQVRLLPDATTDHSPVLLEVAPCRVSGSSKGTESMKRRNFKAVRVADLVSALESTWDWDAIHGIPGVDAAHKYVVDGILAALDIFAPMAEIKVKRDNNIYLTAETLGVIRRRDLARAKGGDPAVYRGLRNDATRLVRRDKLRCNVSTLSKAAGDPRVLWQLANTALGKPRATLPKHLNDLDGNKTVDDKSAADLMATYYVKKVVDLRAEIADSPDAPTPAWPPHRGRGKSFSFSFASAGRIAKVIKGLKNTEALGVDGIPVSILKKGVDILSSPLAHLVNRSMTTGVVPSGFKLARVCPIYKGAAKSTSSPSSYRPVAILPALSKVLETLVKTDLERFFARTGALPRSQHGFRLGRSCTTALGTAHSGWVDGIKGGNVVGVAAYDLSAAFDTVAADKLIPKLERIGVRGRALAWFVDYMRGGKQSVVWNDAASDFVHIEFGVRQGSILGPVLFLLHVADMGTYLASATTSTGPCAVDDNTTTTSTGDDDVVVYADDSNVWVVHKTWSGVKKGLEVVSARFATWSRANGLHINVAKTQILVSAGAGRAADLVVNVDGKDITSSESLELLGVRFDRSFTTRPHIDHLVKATRQRAALIARLSHHLPRGAYLRQLAHGLVFGKLGHALAVAVTPRLTEETPRVGDLGSIQVTLNKVARYVTGTKVSEHITVGDLNKRAKFPLLNELVTWTVAMETWAAYNSSEVVPSTSTVSAASAPPPASASTSTRRNPLGERMFKSSGFFRESRAAAAGQVLDRLCGHTLVSNGIKVWNACPELRKATTRGSAKSAAATFARGVPV